MKPLLPDQVWILVPVSLGQSEGRLSLWLSLGFFFLWFHVIVHLVSKFFICSFKLENALFTIENFISLAVSPFRQTERNGMHFVSYKETSRLPQRGLPLPYFLICLFGLGRKPCHAILLDAYLRFDAMVVAYQTGKVHHFLLEILYLVWDESQPVPYMS